MIRCQPHHLEQRSTERGYTMAEVAPCIVERHEDGTITVDPNHPAYPRKGLGDAVGAVLGAVGITPERVAKATGKRDCGCGKRKAALNRVGRRITG